MPAATKPKATAADEAHRPIPQRVKDAHRKMRRESLARWRGWAREAASGGAAPPPHELMAAGALLSIPHPAYALEADAEVLREIADAEQGIAECERDLSKKLEPWGGDRRKLIKAVEAAEDHAKGLRQLLTAVDGGGGLPFWQTTVHQLRVRSKRLWPDYEDEVIATLEDCE